MKLNKILAVVTAGLSLTAFTACNSDFDGTKVNYSGNEKNLTTIINSTAGCATITVDTSIIAKASANSIVEISIDSLYRIDVDSLKAALKFQKLEKTTSTVYYPKRGEALAYEIVDVDYDTSAIISSAKITVSVNTSTVETEGIAVYVDATKLKDKKGTLILNENGNSKAGEKTDSFLDYIDVTKKADGTATETIDALRDEFTYAAYPISPFVSCSELKTKSGEDLIPSGTYRVKFEPFTLQDIQGNDVILDDLKSALDAKYSVELLKAGTNKIEKLSLSFTFVSEDVNNAENPSLNLAKNSYYADFEVPFAASYDIIETDVPGLRVSKLDQFVGCEVMVSYSLEKTVLGSLATGSNFYVNDASESEYIVESYNSTATEKDSSKLTISNVKNRYNNAQKSFVNVTKVTSGDYPYFEVEIKEASDVKAATGFASVSGLKIVDVNDKVIPTKVIVIEEDSENGIQKVRVYAEDKNLKSDYFTLYADENVTLKKNTARPSMVKFGKPFKLSSDGSLAGMVPLYLNIM